MRERIVTITVAMSTTRAHGFHEQVSATMAAAQVTVDETAGGRPGVAHRAGPATGRDTVRDAAVLHA
jgi:hypothetical protein